MVSVFTDLLHMAVKVHLLGRTIRLLVKQILEQSPTLLNSSEFSPLCLSVAVIRSVSFPLLQPGVKLAGHSWGDYVRP
jgi:hypothetical protein